MSSGQVDDLRELLEARMLDKVTDVFSGLKSHLDAGTEFINFQQCISGLKNDWGNFSDGSKWILNYVSDSKGLSAFSGKKLQFELPTDTELGLRRIDIADITNGSGPNDIILYEFKSVQNPFNSTYATQFVKDLNAVDDLSQIKWLYDGSKVSSLNKTQILDLIENANIPQNTINKYFPNLVNPPKSKLIELLDDEFDNIFRIINL